METGRFARNDLEVRVDALMAVFLEIDVGGDGVGGV